jgi:hypothetical protein
MMPPKEKVYVEMVSGAMRIGNVSNAENILDFCQVECDLYLNCSHI